MSTVEPLPTRPAVRFEEAARVALANTQLRRNMGKATQTIRAKRQAVVQELPDWEALREAGRAIKERVVRHLDTYLLELEVAVERAGGVVHWARDAAEASAIVTRIAAAHGAREVVKIKSLTTEEIGLNEALDAAGIHAIETDLAELIIQLAGERSSHILVPAIHKNRAEIRTLFMKQLGVAELSDEAPPGHAGRRGPELTWSAKFLGTPVAVSGANFAVSETGSVCIVESEGNGRMCLTLPKVLISVMGLEKVIPSWQDFEVFLQLLPRSSTGERMNPYTSFWTGVTPGDGPEEFHLILLDNGRTRVLEDPVGRQATSTRIPVQRLPQHLPRLRTHRRPCLPVGLPRPDRRHPDPATRRRGERAVAALCLIALRRFLLRDLLPGQDQHPRGPDPPAGAGCPREARPRRPACLARSRGTGDEIPGPRLRRTVAVRARPEARPVGPAVPDAGRHDRAPAGPAGRLDRDARRLSGRDPDVPRVVEVALMTAARTEILRRIRAALLDVSHREKPKMVRVTRDYLKTDPTPNAEQVERFIDRVAEYKATIRRVAAADVPAAIAAALVARGVRTLVVPTDLPAGWLPGEGGVRVLRDTRLTNEQLESSDGVLTAAALGIAQTGTIVLDGGPGQGPTGLLTLLPSTITSASSARIRSSVSSPRP